MANQNNFFTRLVSFFHNHTFISAIFTVSLLVLLAGIIIINASAPEQAVATSSSSTEVAQLAAYHSLANNAAAELENMRTAAASKVTIGDMKPEFYAKQVAELKGEAPVLGSEGWCALMMIKDADDWTVSEQQLFSQHCL